MGPPLEQRRSAAAAAVLLLGLCMALCVLAGVWTVAFVRALFPGHTSTLEKPMLNKGVLGLARKPARQNASA